LRAKAAARLMAVVVFPTPPFWLAMAITIRCTVSNYRSMMFLSDSIVDCRFPIADLKALIEN
jgi:hypothetical protein